MAEQTQNGTENDQKALGKRRRLMTTRRGVVIADVISRACIKTGGIGTIVAVLGVCVFLLWVVLPLFFGARVEDPQTLPGALPGSTVTHAMIDDYLTTGAVFGDGGQIQTFSLKDGTPLKTLQLFTNATVSAFSFRTGSHDAVFALSDNSLAIVNLSFKTAFRQKGEVDEAVRVSLDQLPAAAAVPFDNGVIQLTPERQYRTLTLATEVSKRQPLPHGPVRVLSHAMTPAGALIAYAVSLEEGPAVFAVSGEMVENMMTGTRSLELSPPVHLPLKAPGTIPDFLAVAGSGQDIYAAWRDGRVQRIRCTTLDDAFVAERGRLVSDGAELTALNFALGATTLLWGDSKGLVRGGFPVRRNVFYGQGLTEAVLDRDAAFRIAVTKTMGKPGQPVRMLVPCARSRLIFVGHEDGTLAVYNTTSEARLVRTQIPGSNGIQRLAIAPREDGILALASEGMHFFEFDPMYTEADFNSLFRPVWYEGYPAPMHMWQSSSASDDFEPKMGLMPLIFGTLKATLYAMLFGAPIALLAAIFSSEFLRPNVKAVVKPMVEMMASLPSVVLGFLGALVFAPFLESVIPATLLFAPCCFASFLLGAYLWQTLPSGFTRRYSTWRLLFMVLPVAFAVVVCGVIGPVVEKVLFAGNIRDWLSWQPRLGSDPEAVFASPFGGWALLMLPLSMALVFIVSNRWVTPRLRRACAGRERQAVAWFELSKFCISVIAVLAVTAGIAALFSVLGVDPRHDVVIFHTDMSVMDTYVQRNALIVGIVMGFAVIPIIYTIADDALAAVPDHLRSASLGSGATTWQTAIRIVIPTAMSGLFSAMMIGLGRAVGETMIVLMALGNTAIMDWNIFNGARTLSANIAVELPEAVRNSAHYRTLFLAGLVLFAMTFVVNTVAESVRLRFRKRAYQL